MNVATQGATAAPAWLPLGSFYQAVQDLIRQQQQGIDRPTPRIHCGGVYYVTALRGHGLRWICTAVVPHGIGWRVEYRESWTGCDQPRTRTRGYREFCSLVGVQP